MIINNSQQLRYQVNPSTGLSGQINVPGDKSISHRALILAALTQGRCEIRHFLNSEDCLATSRALQAMGVVIDTLAPDHICVHGVGMHGLQAPKNSLDLGNAGTAIRLLTGLLAGYGFDATLTGDHSLCQRPMRRVTEPLGRMGAQIQTSQQGTPPLQIKAQSCIKGITYQLPVASAQVKSALLLAGMYAQGKTCIGQPAVTRDHTERMLADLGYPIMVEGDRMVIEGGHQLQAQDMVVPGDLSSAAFFMVGACISRQPSALLIQNVGINPTRTGVIDILKMMGANITIHPHNSGGNEPVADILVRSGTLQGITIPPALVPLAIDEFPILFIAAACAQGETTLSGAKELRVKESDRIAAMVTGLNQLGIDAHALPDGAVICGGQLQGGQVSSFGDHRIAMSFAMAALAANSAITIENCKNVTTSFPDFVSLAANTGLAIEEKLL